jgi:hypothetical protein
MGDESEKTLRCWALGIKIDEVAVEMLAAADAARSEHPTRMGQPVQPPDIQRNIDEVNRGRILYWAREFDRVLTLTRDCGVDPNGYLGGEFGRIQDWESYDTAHLNDLAMKAQRIVGAVHVSSASELGEK